MSVQTTPDSLSLRAHAAACRAVLWVWIGVFWLGLLSLAGAVSVTYDVVHSFEKPGTQVVAPLVQHSNGSFYGVASAGGAYGFGSVFQITPDGTLTTLYSFSEINGSAPVAGLVEGADQALYGTTASGGISHFGVVYKITTAGVFTKLVDFTGSTGAVLGSVPHGLMLHPASGNFFGVTQGGGAGGFGTVFSMTPAGVVTTLAELTGATGACPGNEPLGPLVSVGSMLYGVTKFGGSANFGVLFEISTTGTWRTLAEFTGTTGLRPGANATGGLLLNTDGALYGTTEFGGSNDFGVAFKITTAASPVYTTLRHFADLTGSQPTGALVRGTDGLLYGTTASGGANGWGTAFKITTTGTHTLLTSFTGQTGVAPGASPRGGLSLSSAGPFHAVTSAGGTGNLGQAFKVAAAGTYTGLAAVSLPEGWTPSGAPVISGSGELLFPVAAGGTGGGGNIMSLATTGLVSVAAALGGTLGSTPDGALKSGAGGVLYGVTARGGASSRGTFFRYTPGVGATLGLAYTTSAGSLAEGPLTLGGDGLLYGIGREGGASTRGTLYKITTAGVRTRLTSFSGTAGAAPGGKPRGPLALAADGNFYGLAEEGGTSNTGVIFRLTAAGVYSVISHFAATGARSPQGGFVVGTDGFLYGTTSAGGTADAGTLIRFNPATSGWSILGEFTGTFGAIPGNQPAGELLVAADGALYGMTLAGGASDQGTIFRYTEAGGLESLVSFTGAIGAAPGSASADDGAGLVLTGGLAFGSDGELYGVAPGGGEVGGGVVFHLTLTEAPLPPLSAWKLANLGNENALDTDDLDHDSLPNLLEYALATVPDFPDSESLPQGQIMTFPEGDRLSIEVVRDPEHNDITVIVEVSSTLQPTDWTTLATSTLGSPFTGPGYFSGDSNTPGLKLALIRDTQSISATNQRFIRIRVVH